MLKHLDGDDAIEPRLRIPSPDVGRFDAKILQPRGLGARLQDGGGRLFGQPAVSGRLLDDAVGQRFLVLARDLAGLGASADWWADTLGAWVTTLDELPDPDASLKEWFERRGSSVVVLRPDRYLLAATDDLDEVTAAVAPLLAASTPR